MSLGKKLLQIILPHLILNFVRVLTLTLRIDRKQRAFSRSLSKNGKNVIYAFWHSDMIVPGFMLRKLGVKVLVSQHRDGGYLADALEMAGFDTVRGSSTRGGARAMVQLTKSARKGSSVMITPDGPRGPRHIVQPGIIFLAKKTGLPIIPMSVKTSKYWQLPSWDKFVIPKPFSKLTLVFGKPIYVSPELNNDDLTGHCDILTKALNVQDEV